MFHTVLKGNSSQNTSVVHMKDLTDFSLLPNGLRVPMNLVKKISVVEVGKLVELRRHI